MAVTRSELLLLRALLERTGAVVAPAALPEAIWGEALPPGSRAVHAHIARLRAKLRRAAHATGMASPVIAGVRGLGYCLLGGTEP